MKVRKFISCFSIGAALAAPALLAHSAAAQARRQVQDAQLAPDLQGELALKNGDYVLLELFGTNVPAYDGFDGNNRLLGLDQRGLGARYEHFWNDHWSWGASLQHVSTQGIKYVLPEVLLRHRSAVGPLTFGQRLSVFRTVPFGEGHGSGNDGATFATLRVDLEKLFPLGNGGIALRPRLSYEADMHLRLGKQENQGQERTINRTILRGELGVRFGDHFDFTPWVAYSTAYYFTIQQFDAQGNLISDGRLNSVTPVIGLDARFTLFSGKTAFERKQLPTQH